MPDTLSQATITVHSPEQQGRGAFDDGRITEIKPIGFPGEASAVARVGPLFYWAWATSHAPATIAMHPHRGFEIISYVIRGELEHRDTLDNVSRVTGGGAQIMQTGSGVSHEERMPSPGGEFFQIWFEPELRAALQREPTYLALNEEDFPIVREDGVAVTSVLGGAAPASLVTDAQMVDLRLAPQRQYRRNLAAGRALAAVVIEGEGVVAATDEHRIAKRDFIVIEAGGDSTVTLSSSGSLRLVLIEIPLRVDYPLLGENRYV